MSNLNLQGNPRVKIVIDRKRLTELAAQGLSRREIAGVMEIPWSTFRLHLESSLSLYQALERGEQRAGKVNKRTPVYDEEERQIPLVPFDQTVLEALLKERYRRRKLPTRKRIGIIRAVTGCNDLGVLVRSLERLILRQEVVMYEGITFTEYEAVPR
ncbi:MAG: hypothetical protein ABL984_05315 [Pyrinomonadaceae bacterium]